MQKSRILTDKNVAFKRIDTDAHGQTLPTKQLKTPGFEVTVWCFVPNLILLLDSFNLSVVKRLNFMVFMQVYKLQLSLFNLSCISVNSAWITLCRISFPYTAIWQT